MTNRVLGIVYLMIYGGLLLLTLLVTLTTNVGIWGVLGILGFGWLVWRQSVELRGQSRSG